MLSQITRIALPEKLKECAVAIPMSIGLELSESDRITDGILPIRENFDGIRSASCGHNRGRTIRPFTIWRFMGGGSRGSDRGCRSDASPCCFRRRDGLLGRLAME
jgi:hypothetical protein